MSLLMFNIIICYSEYILYIITTILHTNCFPSMRCVHVDLNRNIGPSQPCITTYTYIHTHIHIYIHIYLHTYIHTHTHTRNIQFTNTRTHKHNMFLDNYAQMYVYGCFDAHFPADSFACNIGYCNKMISLIDIFTHLTYMHTYIRTHLHYVLYEP